MENGAYENSRLYTEKMKRYHGNHIRRGKQFEKGDQMMLFNSRLRLFPVILKSRWYRPFTNTQVFLYGTMELWNYGTN